MGFKHLLIALASCILLAACGGGQDDDEDRKDPRPPLCQTNPALCR